MTEPRQNQRSRTREAILAGARQVIARGEAVTVVAAAQEAGISKATAYRYFSNPSVLSAEAGLAVQVTPYDDVVAGASTPRERVLAVSLYIFDLSVAHEVAFRTFLSRWLDAWKPGERGVTRGARRVEMFEAALGKQPGLSGARRKRLVAGLAAATGSEAMIGLYDVAHADPDLARDTVQEIALALLDRYLGPET